MPSRLHPSRSRGWSPVRVASAVALLVPLFAAVATTSAATPAEPATVRGDGSTRVIVELAGATSLDATGRRASRERVDELRRRQTEVLQSARGRGIDVTRQASYTSILNGVAVTVPEQQLPALRALPGVRAVHPDVEYRAQLAEAVPHVGAPEVWERTDDRGDRVTGARQTVAVLDTGIDYTHPDLGGCLGRGCRVVGGYDFVNGDDDPMDDSYHGTHVAGIIGAAGEATGVAPDVEFVAYKVLDRNGGGSLANILAALDEATDPFNLDRPTVINMSLGNSTGDGTDLLSQAVQEATDAGYVVVTAAGNTGPGERTIGSPASAPGAITVGASTTGVRVPRARLVAPEDYDLKSTRLGFSANPPAEPSALEVVDVGAGDPADYESVDVEGKAVLIDTGTTPYSWFQAGLTAEANGATAALLAVPDQSGLRTDSTASAPGHEWDVGALDSGDDGRLDSLVALRIPESAATDLRGFLATGPATAEVTGVDATDTIAGFSSRGPSGLGQLKPDLVAPGVEIRSTVPVGQFGGSYGRVSGTSMSAPVVAGAALLLRQLHPRWSGERISAALVGSARQLPDADPMAQGAGLLAVDAAADADVLAAPWSATFGLADLDGATVRDSMPLTLTNVGDTTRSLSFDVVESTGAEEATVEVEPSTVRLVAGERTTVTVSVSLPRPDTDLDVTGWLTANVDGGGGQQLSIPYALSVQPLDVFATPDPAVDGTEIFVRAPSGLADAPRVHVTGPKRFNRTVTARHDHGYWWRARVDTGAPGIYRASVSATGRPAYGSPRLTGETTLEVLAEPKGRSEWTPVGPYGSGGEMAPSPANDDNLLVASDRTTAMFATDDGGRSWTQRQNVPVAGGSGFGAQPMLAADPTSRDRYYLGIDAGAVDPTYRGAVFVTDNGGDSWRRLPYPDDRVLEMVVGPDGRRIGVIAEDAFYLSVDGGQTWRTLWGTWSFATDLAFDGDAVYLATADGLFRYDGVGGDLTGPRLVYEPEGFGYVDQVAADDGTVFVWPSNTGGSIERSTDDGGTWEPTYTPPSTFMIGRELEIVDGEVWATSDEGAWIGRDLGATWSAATLPSAGNWVGDVERFGAEMAVSAPNGLFTTDDDGQSYQRFGIQGVDVNGLALATEPGGGKRLVAATNWDTYDTPLNTRGRPDTLDWGSPALEGESSTGGMELLAAASGGSNVLYRTTGPAFGRFEVSRSDDAGQTWDVVASSGQFASALLAHPGDPDSVYVAYQYYDIERGLLISHDGGATWRQEPQDRTFRALAGDPDDPSVVYAGDLDGFYVSRDAGRTFVRVNRIATTAIEVSPDDPDRIVIGGRGLHMSADGGRTFRAARHGDLELRVTDLAFGPRGQVYAAVGAHYAEGLLRGGRGVLVSRDDGRSFRSMSAGLENLDALSLAVADDGQVYVGLAGGGVYVHR